MRRSIITAIIAALPATALAQVPVHDRETYQEAAKTAQQTADLLEVSKDTLDTVTQTLEAVTGNRDSSSLSNIALGQGFSISQMPNLGDLAAGGSFSWGSMGGQFTQKVSMFIEGLNLIKRLTSGEGDPLAVDRSYESMVNSVAALTAMIDGASSAAQTRRSAFEQAAGQIGQAQDVKGSLDQNTQVQIQSGLTMNEMIGVMNGAVTSLNQQNLQTLTEQAATQKLIEFDPNASWPQ